MAQNTLGEWHTPEWYDPRDGVYQEAYAASDAQFLIEAEVTLAGAEVTLAEDEEGWFWLVKATSRFSEYPELQGAGSAPSKDAAMAAAEAAATKACAG